MCSICLLAFGVIAALAPGSAGFFQQQKISEFQSLVGRHLPQDARGEDVRARWTARLAELAAMTKSAPYEGWKSCVPFLRPNEAKLMNRAETAAIETFTHIRPALLEKDSERRRQAGGRAMDALAAFYTELGGYQGDRSNRALKRAFTTIGMPLIPLVLLGSGVYLWSFPEICGAIPGPLGEYAHYIIGGTGLVGAAGMVGLAATDRGQAWLGENGTPEHDRASGAHRAEMVFWRKMAALWNEDDHLRAQLDGHVERSAHAIFTELDRVGVSVLEACEDALRDVTPACSACAVERAG